MKINFYSSIIRPIFFLLEPEVAHRLTFFLLRISRPLLPWLFPLNRFKRYFQPQKLFGLDFDHPVGLAAGLDKDGKVFRSLHYLGFSHIELGTVTPKPQHGNDRPRLFRLKKDQALINRMGFNNCGVDALVQRLQRRPLDLIIGGNIGKNTDTPNAQASDDYLYCFQKLYDYVDYFVVNVSCPNIADLKDLQDKDSLVRILDILISFRSHQATSIPILLKVSPDLNPHQLDDLIEVVVNSGIEGLIATNTTITRNNLTAPSDEIDAIGKGGLSGPPLRDKALDVIRYLRKRLPDGFPIVASGCVHSENDAKEALEAGAQLIQIYTGFIYEGPTLIERMLKRINE